MTLLNINENKRFKNNSVRFLGCLPIYDFDASLLKSEAKKRSRSLELFHDCMSILSADILEFCEQKHTMDAVMLWCHGESTLSFRGS